MTEDEWFEMTTLEQQERSMPNPLTVAQRYHFAVACCRRVVHMASDERYDRFVAGHEAHFYGQISITQLQELEDRLAEVGANYHGRITRGIQDFDQLPTWYQRVHECVYSLRVASRFFVMIHFSRVASLAREAVLLKASYDTVGLHPAWSEVEAIEKQVKTEIPQRSKEAAKLRPSVNSRFGKRELQARKLVDEVNRRISELKERIHAEVNSQAEQHERAEEAAQCALLRCIVGNPFRPLVVLPAWRTSTVLGLAQTIRAERAFDRMPILADALEDAGCEDSLILRHTRHEVTHCHGCAILQAILVS